MAEPETKPDEISVRAAEAAADVTEAERLQDQQRLAAAFTRAASSSARVAGRGTRAVRRQLGAARRGAGSGTSWLAGQVMAMAPRLRVRDHAALRAQFPGQSAEEIADALIEGASRASATAGGAVGVWAALPTLPAFPAEVAAETLILVGIELKLIAELHEAYGTPAPGNVAERMSAYVAAWAHRRGVFMIPGGLVLATGSPVARSCAGGWPPGPAAARSRWGRCSPAPPRARTSTAARPAGSAERCAATCAAGRCRLGGETRGSPRCRLRLTADVLQPHLAVGDEPARFVGDLVEDKARRAQEGAGVLQGSGSEAWGDRGPGRHGAVLSGHRRSLLTGFAGAARR